MKYNWLDNALFFKETDFRIGGFKHGRVVDSYSGGKVWEFEVEKHLPHYDYLVGVMVFQIPVKMKEVAKQEVEGRIDEYIIKYRNFQRLMDYFGKHPHNEPNFAGFA